MTRHWAPLAPLPQPPLPPSPAPARRTGPLIAHRCVITGAVALEWQQQQLVSLRQRQSLGANKIDDSVWLCMCAQTDEIGDDTDWQSSATWLLLP